MHFGHTPAFTFLEIENGEIVKKELINNPGAIQHTPGSIPQFLHDNRVNVIVTGGMGARAIQFFEQYNIRVVLGASGPVDATIQTILNGELKNGINIAHPDEQRHECGDSEHKYSHNCEHKH